MFVIVSALVLIVSEILVTAISVVVELVATVSEMIVTAISVVVEVVASDSVFRVTSEVETGGNVVTIEAIEYFTT